MPENPSVRLQHPGFHDVVETAAGLLQASGGGALGIYVDGRSVLDMWTGFKDPETRVPWQSDTMAMSWSTTKGVTSTVLHMLADRGELDYGDLIVKYWPEYAAHGKDQTTIRHLMSMEAGLFDIRHVISDPRQMLNHTAMAAALADATPRHVPGTKNGYHAMTYGWLAGELVRRITGSSLGKFVRTQIATPLGLDGCYIGTPEDQIDRVAAFPQLAPEKATLQAVAKALDPFTSLAGVSLERMASAFVPAGGHWVIPTAAFLRAEVPSVNGVFTARSLARLYAALGSDVGVDGVQLWSPATRAAASTPQNSRRDRVIPIKVGWRLGYHQPFPKRKTAPTSFGFYGSYGSGAFADPSRHLAVGLVCQQAKKLPLVKLVGPILHAVDDARSQTG